jgi:hypothetical protein
MSQATHATSDDHAVPLQVVDQAPNGFRLEPRCRVCRHDAVRQKVNDLLASGASYAGIVRALEEDNNQLDVCDRVTIDSVRNHCARHFPVQSAAKATYREIIERRAQEAGVDFVNGVTTALTPIAFFETILVKSFESTLESDANVDVATGMIAAAKLQAVIDSRSGQQDVAGAYVQMNRIIHAVKAVVSPEDMTRFLAIVEGREEPAAIEATVVTEVYDDDAADEDNYNYDDDEDF